MIARLCREQDELRRTKERLRSECSMAHEEGDRAIRDCGEARQEATPLRVDLGDAVAQRLEAKEISTGLSTELAEVRGILLAESDQHDLLRAAVVVVYDDLQVAQGESPPSQSHLARGLHRQAQSLGSLPPS